MAPKAQRNTEMEMNCGFSLTIATHNLNRLCELGRSNGWLVSAQNKRKKAHTQVPNGFQGRKDPDPYLSKQVHYIAAGPSA